MVDYGDVDFKVTFEGTEVGDHTSVSIERVTSSNQTITSSGTRNRKNRRSTGVTVTFDMLDFAEDQEKYLIVRDMLLIRQRIETATISSQKRWQNGQEYVEQKTFLSGSVDVSDSWGVDDDWTRSVTVNFDEMILNEPILL